MEVEVRIPDGGPVVAAPQAGTGGSCLIYCASSDDVTVDGPEHSCSAELTFVLGQRSTFGIKIVWTYASMDPETVGLGWHLTPTNGGSDINSPLPMEPQAEMTASALVTAATRDAGEVTVSATLSGLEGSSDPRDGSSVQILVIVGDDTGDDCVVFTDLG